MLLQQLLKPSHTQYLSLFGITASLESQPLWNHYVPTYILNIHKGPKILGTSNHPNSCLHKTNKGFYKGIHQIYIWPRSSLSVAFSTNNPRALQPGHPPNIHLTQVVLVSSLLYEPVGLPLGGQRQRGHGADTQQSSSQTPCKTFCFFQTANLVCVQTACSASANDWPHRDCQARAHKMSHNSKGNDCLGWDLYGSQGMMCHRPEGQDCWVSDSSSQSQKVYQNRNVNPTLGIQRSAFPGTNMSTPPQAHWEASTTWISTTQALHRNMLAGWTLATCLSAPPIIYSPDQHASVAQQLWELDHITLVKLAQVWNISTTRKCVLLFPYVSELVQISSVGMTFLN